MNHVTNKTPARRPRTNAKAAAGADAPKQEVATQTGGALAEVPEWMRDDSRLGKENIAAEDRIIPRVQLAAAISQPVADGKVEAGHFFHTINEEDLGPDLEIVIVSHTKRYTLWKPRHQGGGILARASDGRNWDRGDETFPDIQPDKNRPRYKVEWKTGTQVGKDVGLGKWGTSDPANEDSQPAATLSHVLIAACPTRPELGFFAILLQRTGEGVAKALLTKIDLDRAPMFGQKYLMGSKVQPGPSGDFHQYTFAKNGYVSQDQYAEFKKAYEDFLALAPKVDDREDPDAVKPETTGNDGDAKGDDDNNGGRNDY